MSLCHLHFGYCNSHHASDTMTVSEEPNKEEKAETGGSHPGGGDEYNMSMGRHWFPPRRDKNPSWCLLQPNLSSEFTHTFKYVPLFSINCFHFAASVLLLNSFLHRDKNPITTAPCWVFSWTSGDSAPKPTQTLWLLQDTFFLCLFFFSISIHYAPDVFQALCLSWGYVVILVEIPVRDVSLSPWSTS